MVASAASAPGWVTHPWVEESAAEVRFGVANGPRGDWPALCEFVAALEELGFDSFWSSDHPVPSAGCWTTLAGLAATTKRIRLGSLVACVYYQNPVVLARTALDVDAMSGGRLVVGLGIGDIEREFVQMGIPWRRTSERQEALEETIGLVRYLWGEELAPVAQKHFAVSAAPLPRGPALQPRISLLIAGGGEQVTLRQVAQYADASNFGEHAYAGASRVRRPFAAASPSWAATVRRSGGLPTRCCERTRLIRSSSLRRQLTSPRRSSATYPSGSGT